jgi:SIR2-like domain
LATTTQVLELLSKMLTKWEAGSGPAGTEILPVLVEDLGGHGSLVETIVRHAGGVFLDAKKCSDGVAAFTPPDRVNDSIDPVLHAVVAREFDIPIAGGERLRLDIVERGGIVRATVGGVGPAGISAGLATMCGVVASLFSAELQESTLAVIKYDESELDADLAWAIWHFFTHQLGGIRVGRLNTLVVLVEATGVTYARHCGRGSSLEYRLGQHGLERRKNWQADVADIQRLRPEGDRPVVLFLGAGFSASSRLPLGDDLRNTALRTMFPDMASRPLPELIHIFRGYVESHNRWLSPSEGRVSRDEFARSLTLERVLREELFHRGAGVSPTLLTMRDLNAKAIDRPGRAAEALGRLMSRQRSLVIVTVNFDQLIETTGPARVFASNDEFMECAAYLSDFHRNGGKIPVLKLHGTLEQPSTIVATVDQTLSGLSPVKTEALWALAGLGPRLPWVYVGYSMRDPDLDSVLALPGLYTKLDEHWVSPFTVLTAQRFTERHRIYNSGEPDFWQRSITVTADVFFEELERAWGT